MNIRLISLTLLGICILGGLIAGFFSRSIEAALTLPPNNNVTSVHQPTPGATSVPIVPTVPAVSTAAPTAAATSSPMPNGVSILAQDTFQRPNQLAWGMASDGREWDGDTNNVNIFSILNDTGQISQSDHAQTTTYNALLGPSITDTEVLLSASVTQFDPGKVNLGVVVRWTDTNNWYKALIDGATFRILKRVNGVSIQLATVPFRAQAGTAYTLRFRAVGAMLFAKAWPAGSTEPNGWMLTAMDTTFPSGFGGIRVLVEQGSTVKVTSFVEMTVAGMI